MSDLIDRQAAIDALENDKAALDIIIKGMSAEDMLLKYFVAQHNQVSCDIDAIVQLPPIQPKRGKWIRDGHHIKCDQCGMHMCDTDREGDRIPTEFCPSCGADMREVTT